MFRFLQTNCSLLTFQYEIFSFPLQKTRWLCETFLCSRTYVPWILCKKTAHGHQRKQNSVKIWNCTHHFRIKNAIIQFSLWNIIHRIYNDLFVAFFAEHLVASWAADNLLQEVGWWVVLSLLAGLTCNQKC